MYASGVTPLLCGSLEELPQGSHGKCATPLTLLFSSCHQFPDLRVTVPTPSVNKGSEGYSLCGGLVEEGCVEEAIQAW